MTSSIGGESRALSAGEGRRVCILTGASGVLGSYFCTHFADRYDIVAVYRRNRPQVPAQDYEAVDPLEPGRPLADAGRPVFAIQADLTAAGDCERVVEAALARFDRIDLLVNAAVASTWAPMLGSERLLASALGQLTTNVVVPLQMAVVVARAFWQGRDEENRRANRNVVNVSSVAGLRLYAGSGQSMYAASKAALNHLTGHMADEFSAIGVRVNATAAESFPSIVSIERAAEAITALDTGSLNRSIVVVDGDRDEVIQLETYAPAAVR